VLRSNQHGIGPFDARMRLPFSEATGQPAVEQCLRGERLICQYLVQRPAKGARRRAK